MDEHEVRRSPRRLPAHEGDESHGEAHESPQAGERLAKLLARRGVASRRKAEEMIALGQVTVNGEVATGAVPVDARTDRVLVDGRPLPAEPELVYYLMYKPRGTITGRDDPQGRTSVLDLMEEIDVRVEPVGRLDFDTEGALILTNDGDLAHQLLHPSRRVPKRYVVKCFRKPDDRDLDAIRTGVFLEDGKTSPALVRVMDSTEKENTWLEITVTEGRNRLVRRMFAKLGHPISKLRRESFATISVRGLERGQVRRLTGAEVKRLREIAAGEKPTRAGHKRGKGFALPKPKTRRIKRNAKPRA